MNDPLSLLSATSAKDGGETFLARRLIRFSDVDPAGIAYYPRIHNIIHEAFEDLWEEYIGVRYYYLIQGEKIGFPMIHTEIDFKAPLRFGERALIRVNAFHIGRSSLGLRYLIETRGETAVDARTTTVCTDLDSMHSCAIPPAYRQRFEQILNS